jgi:putative ABC transport system ATP-binding protein
MTATDQTTPGTTPVLEVSDLRKTFGPDEALRGASLVVEAGEVVALTGPSGSGKSTLLHCAVGLLAPDSGRVQVLGRDLATMRDAARSRLRRREIGLVLQFGQLAPELTATQNVALPLLLERESRGAAFAAAERWLERTGVPDVGDALPGELSGGQQQRVAVARALVTQPLLVCADEPTGALDALTGEAVLGLLLEVGAETGAGLLLVTHDNRVAARADREVVLRDGRTSAGVVA